jgi:NAD/NADP transhydrogenase alpha subunit
MLIGVPKEIKTHEYRVGLVPSSARELIHNGHQVLVETAAGIGIGFGDAAYKAAGCEIAATAADVFAKAEMIVKVRSRSPRSARCCAPASSSSPTSTSPRSRADQGPPGIRLHRDRLRDCDERAWRPAPAGPHE